jgi:LysR family glycine cleavage system transcriptional activator
MACRFGRSVISSARHNRRRLSLNALRAFEAVAVHESFTRAGAALFVSQGTLSRHVMLLERQLDTQLFERRPHALLLTKAGQHLLAAVTRSFDWLERAVDDACKADVSKPRTLRVQMPPGLSAQIGVPILRRFRKSMPGVQIDLISRHGVEALPSDVDVAIVCSDQPVPDSAGDLLRPRCLAVLCHPQVAARHAGKGLAAFINANELVHVRIADLPRHHLWAQFVRRAGLMSVQHERGLVVDSEELSVQYALSGEGLALVDVPPLHEMIREGRLVQPFDVTLHDAYCYYLLRHPQDANDSVIAEFRACVVNWFHNRGGASSVARRNDVLAARSASGGPIGHESEFGRAV